MRFSIQTDTMINSTDLKNGVTFLLNGDPYKVLKYSLIKMGRGGAIVRVNTRNLLTGTTEDKTFSSNVKVDEVVTFKKILQYLYSDGNVATFMDPKTYDQVEVSVKVIEDQLPFIKEGENVNILFWGEKALSCDIPPKVVMKVVDTPPGVKGNSASNVYKDAILENGLKTKVPLFINNNELIRVDTRTGAYVERAKVD
jgi:elongation factor P